MTTRLDHAGIADRLAGGTPISGAFPGQPASGVENAMTGLMGVIAGVDTRRAPENNISSLIVANKGPNGMG